MQACTRSGATESSCHSCFKPINRCRRFSWILHTQTLCVPLGTAEIHWGGRRAWNVDKEIFMFLFLTKKSWWISRMFLKSKRFCKKKNVFCLWFDAAKSININLRKSLFTVSCWRFPSTTIDLTFMSFILKKMVFRNIWILLFFLSMWITIQQGFTFTTAKWFLSWKINLNKKKPHPRHFDFFPYLYENFKKFSFVYKNLNFL